MGHVCRVDVAKTSPSQCVDLLRWTGPHHSAIHYSPSSPSSQPSCLRQPSSAGHGTTLNISCLCSFSVLLLRSFLSLLLISGFSLAGAPRPCPHPRCTTKTNSSRRVRLSQ